MYPNLPIILLMDILVVSKFGAIINKIAYYMSFNGHTYSFFLGIYLRMKLMSYG